jgi:hypothetical protein
MVILFLPITKWVNTRAQWPLSAIVGVFHMLFCPLCDRHISVTEEIQVGRAIFCSICQIPLEVTSQAPVKLKPIEPVPMSELVEGDWGD